MLRLNEKQARTVAGIAGINEKAVHRLSGSLKVQMTEERTMELGINISDHFLISKLRSESGIQMLGSTLREYMQTCPLIVAWVGRGDFKANKIPDNLKNASILHGSRTIGRLKAELIRKL